MELEIREQIKSIILKEWDNYQKPILGESGLTVLARDIVNGFIFGKYGKNEHYNIDEIVGIIDEVRVEKEPEEDTEIKGE